MRALSKGSIFYLISAFTILGIRVGVFLHPTGKIRLSGVPIHHFWIGCALMAFAFTIPRKGSYAKLTLFSFGFAGFADELAFMLRGDGSLANYWSLYSVLGVLIVMATTFFFKNKLIKQII